MGGGGASEAAWCGTCVVGTPVEQRAHPANQHAATWVAGEARPASFHSSYMNATPSGAASGFVNPNQSGGENPSDGQDARRVESVWEEVRRCFAESR